jgi:uncharacterized protein (DUF2252 family)
MLIDVKDSRLSFPGAILFVFTERPGWLAGKAIARPHSLPREQSRACYVKVKSEAPMELKMRNTLSRTTVAPVAALSLAASVLVTTQPASLGKAITGLSAFS